MSEITYPKLKYQGVEIKPGQHHTENPGYIYQKVQNPDEEAGLEGEWHDSPRAAIDAYKANAAAEREQQRTQRQQTQAHERGTPPAGGDGGGALQPPEGDEAGPGGKKDNGGDHEGRPRATKEWPTESEKRKR